MRWDLRRPRRPQPRPPAPEPAAPEVEPPAVTPEPVMPTFKIEPALRWCCVDCEVEWLGSLLEARCWCCDQVGEPRSLADAERRRQVLRRARQRASAFKGAGAGERPGHV